MSADLPPDDDGDALAAELVLGLLDGPERAAALRRLLADRGFAGRVEGWRAALAPLVEWVPGVSPPVGLLPRIEASLDAATPAGRAVGRWRAAALAAMAVAASLLLFIAVRPLPAPVVVAAARGPVLVAQIAPEAAGVPLHAVYDPPSNVLRISRWSRTDAGHSAELWIIGGDGTPHALGLLGDRGSVLTLGGDVARRLAAGATLAISIEPRGGSPTGQPTGPVVAKGTLNLV